MIPIKRIAFRDCFLELRHHALDQSNKNSERAGIYDNRKKRIKMVWGCKVRVILIPDIQNSFPAKSCAMLQNLTIIGVFQFDKRLFSVLSTYGNRQHFNCINIFQERECEKTLKGPIARR